MSVTVLGLIFCGSFLVFSGGILVVSDGAMIIIWIVSIRWPAVSLSKICIQIIVVCLRITGWFAYSRCFTLVSLVFLGSGLLGVSFTCLPSCPSGS